MDLAIEDRIIKTVDLNEALDTKTNSTVLRKLGFILKKKDVPHQPQNKGLCVMYSACSNIRTGGNYFSALIYKLHCTQ